MSLVCIYFEMIFMIYLWIKALHIIAMVAWFAGLFYLPRLFVYHAQTHDSLSQERFNVMQHKLLHVIMIPAAVITLLSGLMMLYLAPIWLKQPWMHVKLFAVLCLVVFHIMCYQHHLRFLRNQNTKTHYYFRFFNEVPTLFLILIVIMVVVKPFS